MYSNYGNKTKAKPKKAKATDLYPTASRKVFNFDLETTGLDAKVHGIMQIAGVIAINGEVKQRFDFRVKPFPHHKYSERALEITGVSKEQIATFKEPQLVYKVFLSMLSKFVDQYNPKDKFTIMGYNVTFDIGFMREYFILNDDKYYGSWFSSFDMIDVHKLFTGLRGTGLYPELEALENMKLETMANYFQIPIEAHDALSDIDATQELYNAFIKLHKGQSVAEIIEENIARFAE